MDDACLRAASHELERLELSITVAGATASVVWMRIMDNPGDWSIAAHAHDSCEFHFIERGSYAVELDGRAQLAAAGSWYLTPPGGRHGQRACDTTNSEWCLNLRWEEGGPLTEALYGASGRIHDGAAIPLAHFRSALEEVAGKAPGWVDAVRSHTVLLILACCRAAAVVAVPEEVAFRGHDDAGLLLQARRFIATHLSDRLDVATVAQALGLGERTLNRLLQRHGVGTIRDLIMDQRIDAARDLLLNTELGFKEIAGRCGFADEFHFSRAFKQRTGIAPRFYRLQSPYHDQE